MNARVATATVIAVAGRRVDAPDAAAPRFPLHNRERVSLAIAAALVAAQPVSAIISSAACGADLLALEAASALGIPRRVILPYSVERFRATSVVDRPGDWGPLFDALVAHAIARADLVILNDDDGDTDAAFAETNLVILSEAEALAATNAALRRAIVVWDGASRGRDDLTAHFRAEAAAGGWVLEEIPTL